MIKIRREWLKEDIDFVINNYPTMKTSIIAEKLNRTSKSIKHIASKYNVLKERNRACKVEGCENKHSAKGYCQAHHLQIKNHGKILTKEDISNIRSQPRNVPKKYCVVCGSSNLPSRFRGSKDYYCIKHYQQLYEFGEIKKKTIKDKNDFIEKDNLLEIILRNRERDIVGVAITSLNKKDLVMKYTWHLNSTGYVAASVKNDYILLHRLIMSAKKDELIDHVDRNPLNNLESNLRVANKSKNAMNSKISSNNTSGFKGVSWDKNNLTWHAYITINQKRKNLGWFKNKEDAIKIRAEAEVKYFKEYRPKGV